MKNVGIIIGRFQTPYLHAGHLHLIATALRECDRVIILLGAQTQKDSRNPYGIQERVTMIQRIFPQIEIVVIWDQITDEAWSVSVDEIIEKCRMHDLPILYYSRDSFIKQYHGTTPHRYIPEIEGYSATKIRQNE